MRGAVRGLIGTLVAIVLLAPALGALAGQIVYTHGNDLWIMGDNGTPQRPLVTAAQVGSAQLYQPSLFAGGMRTEIA